MAGVPDGFGELVPYVVASLVVLAAFALLGIRHAHFRQTGFTILDAVLVLAVAPAASLLTLPVHRAGDVTIAVNVGGFAVPLLVAVRLLVARRAPAARTALAAALVAGVTYLVSGVVPGDGVRVFLPVPVVLTVLLATFFSLGRLRETAPLAYAAGTVGVIVGADLLRLPVFLAPPAAGEAVTILGAGGTRDAVFLVGVLAVLLQVVLFWWIGRRAAVTRDAGPPG